ncbi:storkhead-box protein 1 [Dryobates pubescens]|uniref:storkhead-box protein 1 n=1 Tax=Dryobates pubescens TaxID=118200 RepID=UPI0023B8F026|nr:storkhead-box protein 1 [Dryobates pubescens]
MAFCIIRKETSLNGDMGVEAERQMQTTGDVSPALMNPLSQSHNIPLAEGICRTVLDMNADRVMVTQEALTEQLVRNYPGTALPSHKILYNTLGTLIKERKIYHTGEGYFTVTPNTYFIPNNTTEDKREVPLANSYCCSLPSIIYVVNTGCCANLVKENVSTVSHYRSCHCLPDQNMLHIRHWHLMNHKPNGGGRKGCSESKPSIQTQGISTSDEKHSWDTIKSLTSVKEKLKSKRFGLGLFWRSACKKEKMKEYSTFSAQFPPKEWPVRDEDDLDSIPRDIEHEIIKRINPTLTVDNLIKHTILMQKFEEQKKSTSEGTLAEVSIRLSKDYSQKTESKPAKHTSKTKSKKEKHISRSHRKPHSRELMSENAKLEENLSLPIRNQQPSDVAVESHVIYKKQIMNPFQGLSWRRRSFHAKGYNGAANSQLKSKTRKQERAFRRPQSLNSPKTFGYKHEELATETQADVTKHNKLLHPSRSSLQLKTDSLSGSFSCPQGSILQTDNKSKCFLESNLSEENIYRRIVKNDLGDIKKSPHSYAEDEGVCKEDTEFSLHLKDDCCRSKADAVCELLDQTAEEFKNVCLSNYTAKVNLVKKSGEKYRPKTDEKSELKYDCANNPQSVKLESEGFTDNCHLLYQKAQDGDTCNSLPLDDNFEPCHLPPGHAFAAIRDRNTAVQKLYVKNFNTDPAQCNTTLNKGDSRELVCKESASSAESINGSKGHPKLDFPEGSYFCSQILPTGHTKELKTGVNNCMKAPAVEDFCQANKADSDADTNADTLQNFTYEVGAVVVCCALGSRAEEERNSLGKDLFFKDACTVTSGQKHSEGIENHSITGDSGIDSPRWTEKKMKLPAKF